MVACKGTGPQSYSREELKLAQNRNELGNGFFQSLQKGMQPVDTLILDGETVLISDLQKL